MTVCSVISKILPEAKQTTPDPDNHEKSNMPLWHPCFNGSSNWSSDLRMTHFAIAEGKQKQTGGNSRSEVEPKIIQNERRN